MANYVDWCGDTGGTALCRRTVREGCAFPTATSRKGGSGDLPPPAFEQSTVSTLAVTIYGVGALTFMMAMYALEARGRTFILGFAIGCLLSSIYGFLAGAWPFGVIEVIWSAIALRRYLREGADSALE
jgi:hypothetical protein